MGRLIHAALTSLDGYVEDEAGRFDWAMPDDEVHAAVNDLERPIGTLLYGRRMYETMVFWETAGTDPDEPAVVRDYAAHWRAAEKVVHSRTLDAVAGPRTRIVREFDPEAVRRMTVSSDTDIAIGGAELAAQALRAGLVDDIHLFVFPVLVGGGTRALPDGIRLPLTLVGERRFRSGVVHLHHRIGA